MATKKALRKQRDEAIDLANLWSGRFWEVWEALEERSKVKEVPSFALVTKVTARSRSRRLSRPNDPRSSH